VFNGTEADVKNGLRIALSVLLLAVVVVVFWLRPAPVSSPDAAPSGSSARESSAADAPEYKAVIEGAVPGEWTMDFDAALALAAETGLPLFLNFTGSDWCGWCRLMDKQVFSAGAWQAWARENLVLVWIDFPQDKRLVPEAFRRRNDVLLREFGVGGFPTFILLDPDGKTRLGQTGAERNVTPERFIATLEELLLVTDKSIAALRADMSPEDQARLDESRDALAHVRRKLEDWIQADPEQNEENLAIFNGMREEISHAEAELLGLLKTARDAASRP